MPKSDGFVLLDGKQVKLNRYEDSLKNRIIYLSEDRKGEGVYLEMTIQENISVLGLKNVCNRFGRLDRKKEKQQAETLSKKLKVKCRDVGQFVGELSGGNQQKVAIARMLAINPKIIIMDEPTRGIDVGAKHEIHTLLRELANSGVGVIVISSELPEVIGISDRVMVMYENTISGELTGDEMTEENIIHLASGIALAPEKKAAEL